MKSPKNVALIATILMSYLVVACGQVPAFKKAETTTTTTADAQQKDAANKDESKDQKPGTQQTQSGQQQTQPAPKSEEKSGSQKFGESLPPTSIVITKTEAAKPEAKSAPAPGATANAPQGAPATKAEQKAEQKSTKPEPKASTKSAKVDPKSVITAGSKDEAAAIAAATVANVTAEEKQIKSQNEVVRNQFLTATTVKDLINSLDKTSSEKQPAYNSANAVISNVKIFDEIKIKDIEKTTSENPNKLSYVARLDAGYNKGHIAIMAKPIISKRAYAIEAKIFDGSLLPKEIATLPGIIVTHNLDIQATQSNDYLSGYLISENLEAVILKIEGLPEQILLQNSQRKLFTGVQSAGNATLKPVKSFLDNVLGSPSDLGVNSATSNQNILGSVVEGKSISLSLTNVITHKNMPAQNVQVGTLTLKPVDEVKKQTEKTLQTQKLRTPFH